MAKAIQFLSPIQVDTLYTNVIKSPNSNLNTIAIYSNVLMDSGTILTAPKIKASTATITKIDAYKVETQQLRVNTKATITSATITGAIIGTIDITNRLTAQEIKCNGNLTVGNLYCYNVESTGITSDYVYASEINTELITANLVNAGTIYMSDYKNCEESIGAALRRLDRELSKWDFKRGYGLYGRINDDDSTYGTLVGFIARYGPMVYGYIYDGEKINAEKVDRIYTNCDFPGPASSIYITWNGRGSNSRSFEIRDLNDKVDIKFHNHSNTNGCKHWSYFVYQAKDTEIQWLF